MLMQDFDLIRKKISECMLESIAGKVEVEKQFAVQISFFMNKFEEIEKEKNKTNAETQQILKDLECERNFNQKIFA